MTRALGLVALLILVVALSGCPKPADTTAPAASMPPTDPAAEAPAPAPAEGEQVAAAPAEAASADNKVGIEYYPGAKVEMTQSDAASKSEMAGLSTTDSLDKVVKFYKDKYSEKAAKNAGTAASVEGADVITWTEDGMMRSVTIMKKDEQTIGILLFSKTE